MWSFDVEVLVGRSLCQVWSNFVVRTSWWNFVGRTADELRGAREDWQAGRRFGEVRGYAGERLPAPPFVSRSV